MSYAHDEVARSGAFATGPQAIPALTEQNRRPYQQTGKESDKNKDLGDEMADVLFVLICLANQTGVDLTEALKKNLEKKTKRDSKRHRNNPKLR